MPPVSQIDLFEIVPLGKNSDVLVDFARFHGQEVPFKLKSINNLRTRYGKESILPEAAMTALLMGLGAMETERLSAVLFDFFDGQVQPVLKHITDRYTPGDLEDLEELYVAKMKELCALYEDEDAPRGPSLCCLYQNECLGIYVYAKVLCARSLTD